MTKTIDFFVPRQPSPGDFEKWIETPVLYSPAFTMHTVAETDLLGARAFIRSFYQGTDHISLPMARRIRVLEARRAYASLDPRLVPEIAP